MDTNTDTLPQAVERPALASGDLLAGHEADAQIAAQITRYRDGVLLKALRKIDNHFLNKPVDDFSADEEGFERGLRVAIEEVRSLMHNQRLFR
jgi:hypothetical protein